MSNAEFRQWVRRQLPSLSRREFRLLVQKPEAEARAIVDAEVARKTAALAEVNRKHRERAERVESPFADTVRSSPVLTALIGGLGIMGKGPSLKRADGRVVDDTKQLPG